MCGWIVFDTYWHMIVMQTDILLVLNLVGQNDFMASLQRLGGLPIARCKLSSCDLAVYQSGTEMEYWKEIA